MNSLTVRLPVDSGEAGVLLEAVGIEARSQDYDRSQVSLEPEGDSILLTIKAVDATALRAAYNSYLRLLEASCELLNSKTIR